MNTFEASVRFQVKGSVHIVRTEVRAPSAQDVRWLLWAQFGFHSILTGPMQIRIQ